MGFLRPVLSLYRLSDEKDDGRGNEQPKNRKGKNAE